MLSIFVDLAFGARKRIEQAQLCLRRKQRLVIVRSMKINKIVSEIFQDRQCSWRTIDELARARADRETSLNDEIVLAWFDSGLDQLRINLFQIVAGKDCLDCAEIGPGANDRLIRAFTEQQLQRTDDDRFARAGFPGDGNEARPELPLEFFHEREISDSQ